MPDDSSPRRRFTLADGMILVAASGLAAWLSRLQSRFTVWPKPGGKFSALTYFGVAQLWFACWIAGILGCALISYVRGPRLPQGIRYRRPDWLVVSFRVLVGIYLASVFALMIFE